MSLKTTSHFLSYVAVFIGSLFLMTEATLAEVLIQRQGVLEPGDEVLRSDGSLADLYTFRGEAGQQIRITLESSEFDAYLILIDPNRNKIAENDDANQGTHNAELVITLPENGTYAVVANGHDRSDRGRYELTIVSDRSTGTAQQSSRNSTTFQDLPDGDYRFYDGPLLDSYNPPPGARQLHQEVVFRKTGNAVIGMYYRYVDQNACFVGMIAQDEIIDITYGYQEPGRGRRPEDWDFFTGDTIKLNVFSERSRQLTENNMNMINYCIQGMRSMR